MIKGHRDSPFIIVLLLVTLSLLNPCLSVGLSYLYSAEPSEQFDMYFNAATEKYLQGDYAKSTENLEKALEIQPENAQAKQFLLKILIEAGKYYNAKHEYLESMKFINKSLKIAPNNYEVKELYRITNEILNPERKKDTKSDTRQRLEIPDKFKIDREPDPPAKKLDTHIEQSTIEKSQKTDETQKVKTIRVRETSAQKQENEKILIEIQGVKDKLNKYKTFVTIVSAFSILLISGLLMTTKRLKNIIKKKETELMDLSKKIHQDELEKTRIISEISFANQRADFEKTLRINLSKGHEKLKKELEFERGTEKLLTEQQKEKLQRLAEKSEPDKSVYGLQPTLEQARDRIATHAYNIYKHSPETALNFLNEMINNPNVGIRANVVPALEKIAKPETLDILFNLAGDSDERVTREVIKSLISLKDKIDNNELSLVPKYREKIKNTLKDKSSPSEWIF